MDRIIYIWRDFFSNFFSKRLLVFCVFQFSVLHYYISSVTHFSVEMNYPAAPWILPFLGSNIFFVCVYGISVVYFFSNVPFLERREMYVLMRQGRGRWLGMKLLRIWLSAIFLPLIEIVFSVLLLAPHMEWTMKWGKLYNTLALTNAGAEYNVNIEFYYDIVNEKDPVLSTLLWMGVAVLVTGLVGTVLFAISMCINRTTAMFVGSLVAIMPVIYANVWRIMEALSYVTPFSWLNLTLLYGKWYDTAPTADTVVWITFITVMVLSILLFFWIRRKDLDWIEEEG